MHEPIHHESAFCLLVAGNAGVSSRYAITSLYAQDNVRTPDFRDHSSNQSIVYSEPRCYRDSGISSTKKKSYSLCLRCNTIRSRSCMCNNQAKQINKWFDRPNIVAQSSRLKPRIQADNGSVHSWKTWHTHACLPDPAWPDSNLGRPWTWELHICILSNIDTDVWHAGTLFVLRHMQPSGPLFRTRLKNIDGTNSDFYNYCRTHFKHCEQWHGLLLTSYQVGTARLHPPPKLCIVVGSAQMQIVSSSRLSSRCEMTIGAKLHLLQPPNILYLFWPCSAIVIKLWAQSAPTSTRFVVIMSNAFSQSLQNLQFWGWGTASTTMSCLAVLPWWALFSFSDPMPRLTEIALELLPSCSKEPVALRTNGKIKISSRGVRAWRYVSYIKLV